MLAEHGEFYPFAATMKADGDITSIGADTGEEQPASKALTDFLVGAFREKARRREIRATGICFDVRTVLPGRSERVDAICARLEHEDGEAVDVFLPYRKGGRGHLEFGELFATQGQRLIFDDTGQGAT
jgi:hypothetical protein